MRHKKRTDKLGRKSAHRKATLSNIIASLIKHERVTTKLRIARVAKRYADRIITLAKKNTLHSRRQAIAFLRPDTLQEKENIKKLFDVLGPRFSERPGGYTRIIKLESRRGDNAPMAILEYVDAKVTFKEPKKPEETEQELTVDTEISGEVQSQDEVPEEPKTSEPADQETVTADVESAETDETQPEADTSVKEKDSDINKTETDKKSSKGGFFKKIFKGDK